MQIAPSTFSSSFASSRTDATQARFGLESTSAAGQVQNQGDQAAEVSTVFPQVNAADAARFNSTSDTTKTPVNAPEGSDAGDTADTSTEAQSGANRASSNEKGASPTELSPEELKQIQELAQRDREVRAHERAHQAAGGGHAGAASYTYQSGPDGKRYAIGGEVPIDLSPVPGNPEATIAKMRIVKAAALAPAEPSPQDRNVAAAAARQMLQAQEELAALVARESEIRSAERAERAEQSPRPGTGSVEQASAAETGSAQQAVYEYQEVAVVNAAPRAPINIDIFV